QTTQIPCHGLTKRCIQPKRRAGEIAMQIAASDKSLGTDPTRAEHWPVPRRQAWFAFGMAFLLMVFDYMDRQVVVSMFPALKAEWGLSDKELGELTAAVSITVPVFPFPAPCWPIAGAGSRASSSWRQCGASPPSPAACRAATASFS